MRGVCVTRASALRAVMAAALSATVAGQAATSAVDAAFKKFWDAKTPIEAAAAIDPIVATGVGFDEAYARLKQGRAYSKQVPLGVVRQSQEINGGELFYVLNVPEDYDPAKKYQVRFQLHGGVMAREDNKPLGPDTIGMLEGDPDQIYVIPYAFNRAPWWSEHQILNLRTILDKLKRTYNINENLVAVSGVSDGATGCYYIAMRDTTPYASFLPLNGFIQVLSNDDLGVDGDVSPNNLKNKPFFVVNGAVDPLYPTSLVEPFLNHLKTGGVTIDYRPQMFGVHDVRWFPKLKADYEAFIKAHPRVPYPDTLTLESTVADPAERRAHWLVMDKVGQTAQDVAIPDLNRFSAGPKKEFGLRTIGSRIIRVLPDSNAEALGLKSTDIIVRFNDKTVPVGEDIEDVLADIQPGAEISFLVARKNLPVEIKGPYNPKDTVADPAPVFLHHERMGRVDLARAGNRVTLTTSSVMELTLLISPDQFDFDQPVTVTANGRVVFDGRVQKDLGTLMKWAARDNDRSMLFGAEIHIDLAR